MRGRKGEQKRVGGRREEQSQGGTGKEIRGKDRERRGWSRLELEVLLDHN